MEELRLNDSSLRGHEKGPSYYSAAQTEDAAELDQKIQKLKNQDLEIRIEDLPRDRMQVEATVPNWNRTLLHPDLGKVREGLPMVTELMTPMRCELNLTDTSVQQMKASYLSQQSPVSFTVAETDHEVRAFALEQQAAESSVQDHGGQPAVEVMDQYVPNNLFQMLIQKNKEHSASLLSQQTERPRLNLIDINKRRSDLTE